MVNFLTIIKSRLRQDILSYFFTNPAVHLYLREIASILKVDPGNLSKEFNRLEKEGVFISEKRGNQKYFYINKDYPLYQELKSIVFKTIGIEGSLKKIVERTGRVKLAILYGSFPAKRETATSDIDLLIVGNPDEDKLIQKMESLEKVLHRQINYNIYPPEEFEERIKSKDSFIQNILKRPKVILKGRIDEIR